jgi:hypothetical protein
MEPLNLGVFKQESWAEASSCMSWDLGLGFQPAYDGLLQWSLLETGQTMTALLPLPRPSSYSFLSDLQPPKLYINAQRTCDQKYNVSILFSL